jgi:hypothetical protein
MWQPQEHAQADHRKLEIFAPKYSTGLLRHPTDDSSRGGAAGGEPKDLMFDRTPAVFNSHKKPEQQS